MPLIALMSPECNYHHNENPNPIIVALVYYVAQLFKIEDDIVMS